MEVGRRREHPPVDRSGAPDRIAAGTDRRDSVRSALADGGDYGQKGPNRGKREGTTAAAGSVGGADGERTPSGPTVR